MPLLFLDEVAALRAVHPLVDLDPSPHGRRWPAAMRFHREDYLPSDAATVRDAVEEAVAGAGGSVRGPVAMLGHLRTWGWLFNPLTLYYCFDPSGREVEWTVLEVSNTPWHERCHYVVGPPGEHHFAKAMHVSPFLPAVGTYTLRYSAPEEGIRVSLDVDARPRSSPYGRDHETSPDTPPPQLAASMVLRRRPLDRAGLAPPVVGPPAHDGARVGWHLHPGTAAGRARRPDPPAPRADGKHEHARRLRGLRPGQHGPAVSPGAGRLVLGLAQRSSRGRPGTLRFEGGGLPGARPVVSGSGDPHATIVVHDQRAWPAVLRRGSRGMAESYIAGWWDTDDLTAVVRIAFRRTAALRQFLDATARRFGGLVASAQSLRPPSKRRDRENIAAHYDLSNDFFALMLDPTMAYSCAYFAEDDVSLESAQAAKFEMIAAKLRLGPEDHVIEIGTGWGGFAIHAAEQHGCRVTTTTISEAQCALAEKRVAERGLSDRVTVLGADYRDLEGRYDALVSIEMIEAVDWRRHDDFFATCARLLTDRGRMALQAITIEDTSYERAKLHDDFIRAMVFPGGCLPSVSAMAATVARTSNLRLVDLQDIGPHYAETLRRWRANLEDQRPAVERLGFDERFWRFWTLYLCYCEAAFMERHVSDVQLVFARPGAPVQRVGQPT